MVNELWLALEWHTYTLWLAQSHVWHNVGLHFDGFHPYKGWCILIKQLSKKTDFVIVLWWGLLRLGSIFIEFRKKDICL